MGKMSEFHAAICFSERSTTYCVEKILFALEELYRSTHHHFNIGALGGDNGHCGTTDITGAHATYLQSIIRHLLHYTKQMEPEVQG